MVHVLPMHHATIHLIDDDDSFLRAAARLLRASGYRVKVYGCASDFLDEPREEQRGCVISDLQMLGLNGLDLQEAMHGKGITMPLIFITGNGDIPSTVAAMRKGAVDFLEKRAPKEQLLDAVNRALLIDEKEFEKRRQHATKKARLNCLTDREIEVLGHVVRGSMNKVIAGELGIHERTVKLHRTAITTKLGMHSVAELTRLWMEVHGQLPEQD
jgi:two-component system, LuxR family, response regulator FixJ